MPLARDTSSWYRIRHFYQTRYPRRLRPLPLRQPPLRRPPPLYLYAARRPTTPPAAPPSQIRRASQSPCQPSPIHERRRGRWGWRRRRRKWWRRGFDTQARACGRSPRGRGRATRDPRPLPAPPTPLPLIASVLSSLDIRPMSVVKDVHGQWLDYSICGTVPPALRAQVSALVAASPTHDPCLDR